MIIYETQFVVDDPKRLVLENLPIDPGQLVTVRISIEDKAKLTERAEQMADFFEEVRSLPPIQEITEEEIAAEITAYRAAHRK